MITAAGSGYSRWQDIAVTRWRDDTTCDDTGSYIFLCDVASGLGWSAGFQPSGIEAQRYDVAFTDDHAAFMRRDGAIETRLDVMVTPEDQGELRRVSITNHDTTARDIDVTSYAEIVLATAASDAAHPAFSNLFVETACEVEREMLLATRRRGMPDETPIWLAHSVVVEGDAVGELEWETSRERFLGRGRDVHAPHAERNRYRLSNTVGSVLDPIVSLRRRVHIRSGETARLTFSTFVAPSRGAALALADTYRKAAAFESVADAWRQSRVAAHHDTLEPDESQLFQTLAGHILYPDRTLRCAADPLAHHTEGVDALWAIGISGDLPIIVVALDDASPMEIVRQLLRAHAYWRSKCLSVDVVVVNERMSADGASVQSQLEEMIRAAEGTVSPDALKVHGKTFVFRAEELRASQRRVLESVARAILSSGRGTLADQVSAIVSADAPTPPRAPRVAETDNMVFGTAMSTAHLEFFNGFGGFDRDGSEYVTVLRPGHWTPAPWTNVIANADFGCLVSECGSGCTWSVNSQQNVLTRWSNDPVSDPPSDVFYIRDADSEQVWTPTPLPIREHTGEYVVRHGHGYTRFERESHGVALDLLQFVPAGDPVKIARLTLTNRSPRLRRLSVTAYLEWVLGVTRSGSAPYVTTEMDAETGAMFAQNYWNRDFGTRIAFADLGGLQQSWTGDRTEFLGRNGAANRPAALASGAPLSGRVGAALDPCCALQTVIEVPVGGQVTVVLLLGQAATYDDARALITRYRTEDLDARLVAVTDGWTDVLNAVEVKTPDRALDLMLNQWLLYQTLACRVWARTAFYQASGAYGFRDQLQDVMALAVSRPDVTHEHILKAAARQFIEGDVQHWWHETTGAGVRTRVSDDALWLPYAATHYLAVTGDQAVLDEVVPFLDGAALKPGQTESYFEPGAAAHHGTLFEHCARALDRSLTLGAHGLPLMGTGDWNDGMNRVGAGGTGESVWLAWFLYTNLISWASLAAARGEHAHAASWTTHANAIKAAVEREAWGGAWYTRAFFDDGTPLGVAGGDACAIAAIAQSWSVLSGAGDPARVRQAMRAVDDHLVRRHDNLSLLLTPPFDHTALEPGYIKGYVPGVRENGGQYTHAAVWTAIAFAELGDGDRAAALLGMLNPITRSGTMDAAERYRVEPYVSVGDVYSEPPHVGRGGWSWYTGSAGWMYRAGIEWLLGVRVRGRRLMIDPCIPSAWPGFTLTLRTGATRYDITVENPRRVCRGVALLEVDGVASDDRGGVASDDRGGVAIVNDGRIHRVRAVLGSAEHKTMTTVS
jgi:cyclic beta-1,2-glucan synthetase